MPMKFGLKDAYLQEMQEIFVRYHITQAYIFGSRARGDYKDISDIDIAIKDNLPKADRAQVIFDLQESSVPLPMDIVFYDEIESEKLRSEIDNEGVIFMD